MVEFQDLAKQSFAPIGVHTSSKINNDGSFNNTSNNNTNNNNSLNRGCCPL